MTSTIANEPVVTLDRVSKRFKSVVPLDGLTLTVERGATLGLLGLNGAGKTTTMKLLLGLLRPDFGEINMLGVDPAVDPVGVKQRVGYVPEQHFIYRWMRVREAIAFCRRFYARWDDSLCDQLVTTFALDPNRRVKQLSKGMVSKLALILALSHEPEVLLLDEPMAGLDPMAREEFLDGIVQTICDRDQTVVFSSHTLGDVQRLADTIGIMHEGRLLVQCRVDGLLRTTKRIRAVLSDGQSANTAPPGAIWQRVTDREWLITVREFSDETVRQLKASNALDHVDVIDLGLEDIFKDYVRGWRTSA